MRTPEAEWAGGMGMGLGGLARLSSAQTRSLSAENPTGEKGRGGAASEGTGAGAARELGRGWKISPSIVIEPGRTAVLADIGGPGRHSAHLVHRAAAALAHARSSLLLGRRGPGGGRSTDR